MRNEFWTYSLISFSWNYQRLLNVSLPHKMSSSGRVVFLREVIARTVWTCSLIISVAVYELACLCPLVAAKLLCKLRIVTEKKLFWCNSIKNTSNQGARNLRESFHSQIIFRLVLGCKTPGEKNVSLYVCKIPASVQTSFWQKPLISIRVQMTKN